MVSLHVNITVMRPTEKASDPTMKKLLKLTKRQTELYVTMRVEAKRGFDHFGNWDWTSTSYWRQDERSFDFPAIKLQVLSDIRCSNHDVELGVMSQEAHDMKLAILNQVIKFCDARIKSYKEC